MKRLILLLGAAIAMSGCMKRSLSSGQISELLNGVNKSELHSLDYYFEGNHAGYTFIARIEAPREVIMSIIDSSTRQIEIIPRDDPDFSQYRRYTFERILGSQTLPDWLDINWSGDFEIFLSHSSNGFSSWVERNYFYDKRENILYIAEGGI